MLIDTRNDKKYIGKHIGNDNKYWSGGLIPNRIAKKYGKDIFIRIILENDIPNNILNDKEIYYIKHHNSMKEGYNLTPGGDGGDTISNNPNKDIIINKISNKLKGRIFSDEHLFNLKENHMSKNPLNRKKLSDSLKCLSKTDEHKKKISDSLKGHKLSNETKNKIKITLNNKDIKEKITKYNKDRGELKRIENIKNFIYNFNNGLINNTNIKKYKYKLWCWKKDLGEETLNSIIPKSIIDEFIELCNKIKSENIKIRTSNFVGFTHSDSAKLKISNYNKDNFLKYCDNIHKTMMEKNVHYLVDAFPKNEYEKIRKKIKSSKFLINLNDEIKERLLKLKQNNKKVELIPFYGNFYGNKNKTILIEGFEYNSISNASKKLNIDRGVIRYRLKSKNFLSYNYI
jgi:hypothetical protein